MRIAHLDTGREWRGGQQQVLLLMKGLAARGHQQVLLAPPGPLLERVTGLGLPARAWRSAGDLDAPAVWSAWRALRSFRPQVAHLHSARAHALGVLAARAAGVAVAVVARRVDFEVGGHAASAFKYRLPVDAYLCISRGVAAVLRRAGVAEERIELVPSGIDLSAPLPQGPDLRELIGAPPDAPVVGTVAALADHKDHATLLRAAARVAESRPGTHFAWLGEGECRPALERLRAELGLARHLHLLGFRPDARALLGQFTVFALSSHLEGLCTSLLDAQAAGIPIAATAVGGIPEVVEHEVSGLLSPARDPAAFADSLLRLLGDAALRARLVSGGKSAVARFDVSRTVERTEQIYRERWERRRSGRRKSNTSGASPTAGTPFASK